MPGRVPTDGERLYLRCAPLRDAREPVFYQRSGSTETVMLSEANCSA